MMNEMEQVKKILSPPKITKNDINEYLNKKYRDATAPASVKLLNEKSRILSQVSSIDLDLNRAKYLKDIDFRRQIDELEVDIDPVTKTITISYDEHRTIEYEARRFFFFTRKLKANLVNTYGIAKYDKNYGCFFIKPGFEILKFKIDGIVEQLIQIVDDRVRDKIRADIETKENIKRVAEKIFSTHK